MEVGGGPRVGGLRAWHGQNSRASGAPWHCGATGRWQPGAEKGGGAAEGWARRGEPRGGRSQPLCPGICGRGSGEGPCLRSEPPRPPQPRVPSARRQRLNPPTAGSAALLHPPARAGGFSPLPTPCRGSCKQRDAWVWLRAPKPHHCSAGAPMPPPLCPPEVTPGCVVLLGPDPGTGWDGKRGCIPAAEMLGHSPRAERGAGCSPSPMGWCWRQPRCPSRLLCPCPSARPCPRLLGLCSTEQGQGPEQLEVSRMGSTARGTCKASHPALPCSSLGPHLASPPRQS